MDTQPDTAQSTSAEQSAKRRCEAEEPGPRRTARTVAFVQPFLHSTDGAWSGDSRVGQRHNRVRPEGTSYEELQAEVSRTRELAARLHSCSQQMSELSVAAAAAQNSSSADSEEFHAQFVAAQVALQAILEQMAATDEQAAPAPSRSRSEMPEEPESASRAGSVEVGAGSDSNPASYPAWHAGVAGSFCLMPTELQWQPA